MLLKARRVAMEEGPWGCCGGEALAARVGYEDTSEEVKEPGWRLEES